MSSIGLIINGKSDRSASVLDDLLYVTKKFSNVCTEVLDGITGLGKAMRGMNAQNVDTLIVAGGDGTVQAVFTDAINNQRFEQAPKYVALPCGMTNVIANDCGLQGAPVRSLDNFLWRLQKGNVSPLKRPLLSVQHEGGGAAPVYGFFFGAGAFCSAVDFSRSKIQANGAKRSLALVSSVASYVTKVAINPERTISPIDMKIHDEDCEEVFCSDDSLRSLYMSTTLSRLGSGIYPFWGKGDGPLSSTVIGYPTDSLIRAALFAVRGKSRPWFQEKGIHSWRSNRQILQFDGRYVFDGEFETADAKRPLILETSHNANFLH